MELRALAVPVRAHRADDADAALVAAARRDPQAFVALYDRYFSRVLGYARLRIGDPATCEDVTSHVFTTALAHLHRLRGGERFGGWLFQIARNAVIDVQRRPATEELPEELADATPDVDSELDERVRVMRLRSVLRSLEPEQQHLLALRYGAGLSFDEIGAVLRASPGTVRVRLHRLLHELRKRCVDDE